jgi:hypothetical protein
MSQVVRVEQSETRHQDLNDAVERVAEKRAPHGGVNPDNRQLKVGWMKKPFVSFFLVYFLVDSILTLSGGLARLNGVAFVDLPTIKVVMGILSFLILPFAIIQLVVSMKNKLKLSATILGLYPLTVSLISFCIGIYLFMIKQSVINMQEYSHALYVAMIVGGFLQLSIGVWAATDLSTGHYRKMD